MSIIEVHDKTPKGFIEINPFGVDVQGHSVLEDSADVIAFERSKILIRLIDLVTKDTKNAPVTALHAIPITTANMPSGAILMKQ